MARKPNIEAKNKLIFQAFLLYSKQLHVTFEDLEKATNLSRGALLYHVKTKDNLFKMVVDSSLLNKSSIIDIPLKEKDCLKNFIQDFIKNCENVVKTMKGFGISNINLAHYTIESNALHHYEGFGKIAKHMYNLEIKGWANVIKKAAHNGEIKDNFDSDMLARLFLNMYLGHAYTAAKEEDGCDLDLLQEELLSLYEIIKK